MAIGTALMFLLTCQVFSVFAQNCVVGNPSFDGGSMTKVCLTFQVRATGCSGQDILTVNCKMASSMSIATASCTHALHRSKQLFVL